MSLETTAETRRYCADVTCLGIVRSRHGWRRLVTLGGLEFGFRLDLVFRSAVMRPYLYWYTLSLHGSLTSVASATYSFTYLFASVTSSARKHYCNQSELFVGLFSSTHPNRPTK